MKQASIVIVGDHHYRGRRNSVSIERPGLKLTWVEKIGDAECLAEKDRVDLMLVALNGSSINDELLSLRRFFEQHRQVRVMFFSGDRELSATLSGLEALHADQLAGIVAPAPVQEPQQSSGIIAARGEAVSSTGVVSGCFGYEGLVGASPEIRKLKNLLLKIAPTDTTVLLQGESGTGKEVIARAIHHHSSRSNEVFIPVDCAAISENIIESELFGHARGAFTGADRATLGLIRSADKGTLFLDEIGELPMSMQVKLLRTLQERAVKPVGETRIHPVDIRIVAATNINLAEAVKQGRFRQDLYYRLNAITIYAPPLRERIQDLPSLCDHFLKQLVQEGYPEKRISAAAMDLMCISEWPGNVRELENVLRRAATLASGPVIGPESLDIDSISFGRVSEVDSERPASVAFHEKEAIRQALNRTRGNRRAAAELLDISEATLYRRLKIYSL